MQTLILKLTLAPGLVAVATVVARRIGPRAGGMVSGLPVVAAPILIILSIENGTAYARAAAAGAVLGVISLVGFCVAYIAMARRRSPPTALLVALLAFAAGTVLFSLVSPPLAMSIVLTVVVILGAAVPLARQRLAPVRSGESSTDLLLWRVLLTAILVLALTGAARGLSAHLAGLLTPAPIITSVMAVFTHARMGSSAAGHLLSGLVPALVSFVAFFGLSGILLSHIDPAAAYACAVMATLGLWGLSLRLAL